MGNLLASIRLKQIIVAAYLGIAFFILIFSLVNAFEFIRTPFPGFFIEPVGVVSPNQPFGEYMDAVAGLDPFSGYQVKQIGQGELESGASPTARFSQYSVGDEVSLTLRSFTGEEVTQEVRLTGFRPLDQVSFFFFPYFTAWIYLVMAFWACWNQRASQGEIWFTLFATSMVIVLSSLFDIFSTHRLFIPWLFALSISGASIVKMSAALAGNRSRLLAPFVFGLALVIPLVSLFQPYAFSQPALFTDFARWVFIFVGVSYLLSLVWSGLHLIRSQSPLERQRGLIIIAVGLIAFGPIGFWLFGAALGAPLRFSPWYLLPMAAFPIMVGYISHRYRLIHTRFIASRSIQYSVLALFITLGYALLVTGATILVSGQLTVQNPLLIGMVVFILALLFFPLRQRLFRSVDALFFRSQDIFQKRLNAFSGELTGLVNLAEIIDLLRRDIYDAVQPDIVHVFLFDEFSEQYRTFNYGGQKSSDLRFPKNSPLPLFLHRQTTPQYFSAFNTLPDDLKTDGDRITLLAARLYIPLQGQQALLGWLVLGEKLSGEAYTANEINYLDSLSDQASLALERSQVINNLERRVTEMNVLTRISQGVNYTIHLDDIFELIYAQTRQIIPLDDFYLVLEDMDTKMLIQLFCVEDDERIFSKENQPIPAENTLEQQVIFNRRARTVADYAVSAREEDLINIRPGLSAAILVPLNTGAETIGVMQIGMRASEPFYTQEQARLLQAIADQVAGAIEKARLLQESERRARQLATLNEVARQLTSTLNLEPLLQNVMDNSVEILNCEAGSLLMVDEDTSELIFEVVVGPVAGELHNRRLPPGTGVVGKAVDKREAIIINNVLETADWYAGTDQQTGFQTRSLLVVPLQVQNKVLGVIEVINRKDGLPFSRNDQEILSAFAAQASVALENAKLYMQTDQALTDRVEELSIMQRIDRELNASLNLERSMRITLDWAMRQTKAQAGLIGFVVEDGIRIFDSEGFAPGDLADYRKTLLPKTFFRIEEAINSGQPLQVHLRSSQRGIMENTRTQILVPVRREAQSIALILLELDAKISLSENEMRFLLRLSDHASIAIVNGQLYSEVQDANVAKSEFVSFVAHELKNPMTSIKGYTELLAAGAVGEVNEAQTNFLGTIRTNIDRMNTLVTDLNDLSKIEAGRLRLDFKSVHISSVVDEVIRSTKRQIDEKEQTLQVDLPENLPPVWADPTRLAQVMVNLVSNAHKYTENGGEITITAAAARNKWDAEGSPQVLHIAVKDTGIGISQEDQKKIFQKFFRSEDPKTREVPGTGLGLNITRSLVEMQGGKIWFESIYRQGTTFHLTIPVAE